MNPVARDPGGRVHLTLQRDPASGEETVALAAPLFDEAWQNEIAAAAAQTAHGTLARETTLESIVALARNAMDAADRLIATLLARAPAGAVACRAGCDHCCYQSVGVTPPEALAIFDHLSRTLLDGELAQVAAHVAAHHARTRGLSTSERFSPQHPCAFLDVTKGRCTIYDVRPLSCRGMNSLDAAGCEKRLRDPDARAAFLADGVGGRSYMEPIRTFHAISAGLQLGVGELHGLDMRPLDLGAVLDLLLNGPPALPDAWIAGASPFESARGGDATDAPGLRDLSGRLDAGRGSDIV
ncbi:MAG TPA: YkgJ family cysteine cluster protein [Polyangia bacterium]|jgi:Fe-S-cluster containining protein|nr:YkgJ family cysteine cluster protein [Polyangia bacterium]